MPLKLLGDVLLACCVEPSYTYAAGPNVALGDQGLHCQQLPRSVEESSRLSGSRTHSTVAFCKPSTGPPVFSNRAAEWNSNPPSQP